ncbi:MAG: ABC transporter substrate-binding protein [Dehalococcoidia bacterium]|nr:ABC transporter substrate-binding protein [Dehalococcoidia bacterium]
MTGIERPEVSARRWSRRAAISLGATALGAAGLAALGCAPRPEGARARLERVRLALDWTPNTNHTGFFVADREGWYREAGIELDVLPYSGGAAETLLGAGQANFGIAFQDSLVFARASGLPVVSTMAILQHIATEIAVKAARTDIKTPKDLDGKTYAGFGLPYEVPTLQHVIRSAGGTGKFEVVTLKTAAYEALYSGAADFTVPFVTWEGIEAELHGQALRTFRYTDYGFPDFYQVVLAANEEWVAKHTDLARRFVRATVRGFEFAAKQPHGGAQHLIAANKGALTEPELVERSAKLLAEKYYLDERGRFGTQTLERWTAYSRFLYATGTLADAQGKPLTKEPDWSKYFTNDLL